MIAARATRDDLARSLAERGFAVIPKVLEPAAARALRADFEDDARFRSTVDMARHGFGSGTYRYYRYPLPLELARMRAEIYRELAPIANEWAAQLGERERYPAELAAMLERGATAGQTRCTVLLLRYRAGDRNALHRDLYGDVAFPLQATVLLAEPGLDFDGGEFVIVEQRPRKQSVASVVSLTAGDAVVFANDVRPVRSPSGNLARVRTRHGVSVVARGERVALGLIFHDAR